MTEKKRFFATKEEKRALRKKMRPPIRIFDRLTGGLIVSRKYRSKIDLHVELGSTHKGNLRKRL